jgi:TolA-binding protein
MMEWALAILFGTAVLLLILSFVKTKQSSSKVEQQIEQISFTFTDEVHQLQQQIRNIELDAEILAQEAGIQADSPKERILMREVLDLHKRGYSFESIASKKRLTEYDVEQLLAPYIKSKDERRKVSNDA